MAEFHRRDFMKLGLAASGALCAGMAGTYASAAGPTLHISRTTHKAHMPTPTVCRMCPAACSIVAYTQGQRLITLMGNPDSPLNRGRICARGLAAINLHYLPDRIVQPLKRDGERGSGKWKPVSWAEAIALAGQGLARTDHALIDTADMDDRVPAALTDLCLRLKDLLNVSSMGARAKDCRITSIGAVRANALDHAADSAFRIEPPVPDFARARTILCVGANPFESGRRYIRDAMRIADARVERGAKLIVIDPRLSNTAGRADLWVPVTPGADRLFLTAVAAELARRGFVDSSLNDLTDLSADVLAAGPEPGPVEDALSLASGTVDRVVKLIADNAPVSVLVGDSVAARPDGERTAKAAWAISAVAGSLDAQGGLTFPERWQRPRTGMQLADPLKSYERIARSGGALLLHRANPVYDLPWGSDLAGTLKNETAVNSIVAVTPYLNESSRFADVILPEAMFLESHDLVEVPYESTPLVGIQKPAVNPPAQALPLADIASMLSAQPDIEAVNRMQPVQPEGQWFGRTMEYIRPHVEADSYEAAVARGFLPMRPQREVIGWFRANGFPVAGGKARLADGFTDAREPAGLQYGELVPVLYSENVMTDDLARCKWLAEIAHAAPILLPVKTAKRLRIRDGERVALILDGRRVEGIAALTEGLAPGCVGLADGRGHEHCGPFADAKPWPRPKDDDLESTDYDTELVWWRREGRGVQVRPAISIEYDSGRKALVRLVKPVEVKRA